MEIPYYTIPETPKSISASNAMSRLVDGLGFRFRWSTEALREKDFAFRPAEDSMNMLELVEHLYKMAIGLNTVFRTSHEPKKGITDFIEMRNETLTIYTQISSQLKSMSDDELTKCEMDRGTHKLSFWFTINGQIADSLTHVGQITSWRRIAGNPQPSGVSVLQGTKN